MSIDFKKMKEVKNIIDNYFDWDFFWSEHSNKRILVEQRAEVFLKDYPDLLNRIMENFKENFTDWSISHTNYFIPKDRCLFFTISNQSGNESYLFGVSIFEFFFIVDKNREKLSNSCDTINFIDEGNSPICDLVHDIALKGYSKKFKWLPADVLNLEISNLSLYDLGEIMIKRIVFNCLTSFGVERTI